jgi:hypothetical protein
VVLPEFPPVPASVVVVVVAAVVLAVVPVALYLLAKSEISPPSVVLSSKS